MKEEETKHILETEELQEFKQSALANMEHFLEDGDNEMALNWLKRLKECDKHFGYSLNRLSYDISDFENAFHRERIKENLPEPGINSGYGCLHTLLGHHKIIATDREKRIVATVIQWLGTNCGRSFLHEALKRCGAKIVYKEEQ